MDKQKSDDTSHKSLKILWKRDPILALAGSGAHLWNDEHADEYIHRLREGWEGTAMAITVRIAAATSSDIPLIFRMIKAFAEYERLSHRVTATESSLREALFGAQPRAEALLADVDSEAAGLAIFFPTFSTFSGKPHLYLEDLFVDANWRGRGVGGKLLAHVAAIALERGCERMNWSVLDWNEPALRFYRKMGAEPVKDWVGYGISGEPLLELARQKSLT